ncbi:hypothetical protein ES705_37423 [subsurface metagenome]
MKSVNVRDIRNSFNKILDNKEEVIVLKRGKPVARIKPFSQADLIRYYLEKAQEVSAEMGIDEKKGKSILEKVRKELIDEGRY